MRWLLNLIYLMLLSLLAPVVLYRMIRHGRYRRGWRQRLLGKVKLPDSDKPRVWFHAVSVGEVVQLARVVDAFCDATDDRYEVIISVSTDTGYDLACRRMRDRTVIWFPLDFSWAVSRALRSITPSMVVLMELEIWPNLIRTCTASSIPVVLINARMSARSAGGYQRISRLTRPLFEAFQFVAAQSQEHADRLEQLGVDPELLSVTGSVKFDGANTDRDNDATLGLKRLFGIGAQDLVVVAGSTQAPEEATVLNAFRRLRSRHPELRLILVPRHQERFDEVAELIQKRGFQVSRRSELGRRDNRQPPVDTGTVGLLDTIGELQAGWGLADIAVVGGSFGVRGGQNMIEPAAYGAAPVFGTQTWNFRDVVKLFRDNDACVEVPELQQLPQELKLLVQDEVTRLRMGRRARAVVLANQGATQLTVDSLIRCLGHVEHTSVPARTRRAA